VFQESCIGEHLHKIYNEHKPYVGIFSFDQPSLVIRDLDIVKNILVKDSRYFIDRVLDTDEDTEPMYGRNLFSMNGQRWHHVRTHLTPVFTSSKMKNMFYLVKNCSKELSHYLDRESSDGGCYISLHECKLHDFSERNPSSNKKQIVTAKTHISFCSIVMILICWLQTRIRQQTTYS
jgi:hypothetical protein